MSKYYVTKKAYRCEACDSHRAFEFCVVIPNKPNFYPNAVTGLWACCNCETVQWMPELEEKHWEKLER